LDDRPILLLSASAEIKLGNGSGNYRESEDSPAGESTTSIQDAAHPPWQPGTFDVVMTRHVLWAMPDLQRLEAEVVFLNDEAFWGQLIRDERYLGRSRK
jgi:hypothetical protein